MRKHKEDVDKLNNEIYIKTFSIEYFWRCLVFFLGNETDFNFQIDEKKNINKSID